MEKQTNIPQLRFSEFKGEWEMKKLGEITTYVDYRGRAPIKTEKGRFLVTAKNIKKGFIDYEGSREFVGEEDYLNVMSKGLPQVGDILFTTEAPMGNVAQLERDDIALAQRVIKFRGKEIIENKYLLQYMLADIFQKKISEKAIGTTVQGISGKELHNTTLSFPTFSEQIKIATFLTSVDEKLQALKKKHSLLELYKKGAMQKLFSQELRFKDENGNEFPDWERKKLGEVAKRKVIKNKEGNTNVLTISAQLGLISQLEFFNKSVSAKDVTGYYLIENGDFAYNKSYSKGYPMGAIKCLNRYEKGVVSTLYICFKFNGNISNSFMEHFFETGIHNSEIEKVAQEGARNHGLLNIGLEDFFSIKIKFPSFSEQTKIANYLSALDEKIDAVQVQIAKTETWKKGLLQKMFV